MHEKWTAGLVAAALLLAVLALAAPAQAKDDNVFMLYNDSDRVITSFRTKEGNEEFSNNWIKGDRLLPGDSFEMEFFEGGPCEAQVRVTSEDGYVHDHVIDFCRAREIFIKNRGISYR
ncbi:MAG: hypothetical protein HY910_02925 [Desulfarculus sp.]|nr:hypothetical protein [Desulfarculus sp.]